ncbi:MAG TPA: HAD family phosphatase, partial [Candidatus Dormibacteraeota bacterium]|nr:HAD family phosphatase [Candidatus Dormibacteraeota bacterium]
ASVDRMDKRTSGSVGAVIIDLDGVLVDTEPWWAEARTEVARRHGATWTPEDESSVKGANSREWASAMHDRLGLDATAPGIEREVVGAMLDRYRREPAPRIDGGVAAVRRLAGRMPLAVASSAHPDVIRAALRSLGLAEAFDMVVSGDEVPRGKPEPDVYLEAARRLAVDPGRCLVVEDSGSGVMAARSAGMRVVWVGPAGDAARGRELGADLVLASLDGLSVETIEELVGGA